MTPTTLQKCLFSGDRKHYSWRDRCSGSGHHMCSHLIAIQRKSCDSNEIQNKRMNSMMEKAANFNRENYLKPPATMK